ncbi:PAS domain-containing protein [Nostoc sp. FACHB-110]|uniref:PAS domain-containing protein n=1 Tax=Nostoc sp. FACHB-110 TaxID=2692834 RepID=UPI0016858B14|nr:PAS domain S-box protein [Nostoc sp. FACHB-110]
MTDGFWILDREWRCIYINHRQSELFGLSTSDILGKNFWDCVATEIKSLIYPPLSKSMQ